MIAKNGHKTTIKFNDIFRSAASWQLKCIKAFDHTIGFLIATCLPAQDINKTQVHNIKTILIIRPGGMGDAVFLLPILRILKSKDIKVDLICEDRNQGVFAAQPTLFRYLYRYHSIRALSSVFRQKYDVVIDTEQWHFFSAILSYFINSSFKIGFAIRKSRDKLFHKTIFYGHQESELDNFNGLLTVLGIEEQAPTLKNSFQINNASEILSGQTIALFWGGSIIERRLDRASVKNIVDQILAVGKHIVLVGGGETDTDACWIHSLYPEQITNFVGQCTLEKTAAIIHQCQLFIGTDSGLLHVAVALGVPSLGIFGPGNPDKWGKEVNVIDCKRHISDNTIFGYTFVNEPQKKLEFKKDINDIIAF